MATDLRGLSLRNRINLREYSYMEDQAKPTLERYKYTDEFRDLGKTVDNIEILGRYKNPRWGFLSLSRRNDNYLISFSSYRQSMHKKRLSKSMSERRKLFKIKVKNHDTI